MKTVALCLAAVSANASLDGLKLGDLSGLGKFNASKIGLDFKGGFGDLDLFGLKGKDGEKGKKGLKKKEKKPADVCPDTSACELDFSAFILSWDGIQDFGDDNTRLVSELGLEQCGLVEDGTFLEPSDFLRVTLEEPQDTFFVTDMTKASISSFFTNNEGTGEMEESVGGFLINSGFLTSFEGETGRGLAIGNGLPTVLNFTINGTACPTDAAIEVEAACLQVEDVTNAFPLPILDIEKVPFGENFAPIVSTTQTDETVQVNLSFANEDDPQTFCGGLTGGDTFGISYTVKGCCGVVAFVEYGFRIISQIDRRRR
uniref:Uncharacterized protein n=1 Tax=Chromera velia CCMP2878 TaxID=1169474 RepID=A0A0G4HE01_9ALVE|mmetsp:Transcript_8542/g.16740  ORF Transcript_8542/g.16740 Transcript_8542/m.16740 type:complete len:315 (-) Transcript_8542:646-1590(-)|eukprot:Cvel_26548.t1-p1 / transcript=Cvel_26548.t1 / gene=Cvel_26548 / organism=Chromera_velia_CCMP2878 / gene_product=hypothetical protein / transcript_product=hypothetical protein / location=Cvel_scaffold3176:13807-16138(-) / protein_length=314 / sequence_SO=supercontig / SO=protein_coding / is_pseudo=false